MSRKKALNHHPVRQGAAIAEIKNIHEEYDEEGMDEYSFQEAILEEIRQLKAMMRDAVAALMLGRLDPNMYDEWLKKWYPTE
jgi:hypothetical protein